MSGPTKEPATVDSRTTKEAPNGTLAVEVLGPGARLLPGFSLKLRDPFAQADEEAPPI